jgi:LPXTG-motif cell wall-anchored protein
MLGQWVEVSGRLEKETSTDPDNLRELHVRSAHLVPVVPPRAAAAPPPARPSAPPAEMLPAEPEPVPVPTTGTLPPPPPKRLPKTASNMPAIGLLGLLSLAGALVLRSFRRREQG